VIWAPWRPLLPAAEARCGRSWVGVQEYCTTCTTKNCALRAKTTINDIYDFALHGACGALR
jgi:hypothetical protein